MDVNAIDIGPTSTAVIDFCGIGALPQARFGPGLRYMLRGRRCCPGRRVNLIRMVQFNHFRRFEILGGDLGEVHEQYGGKPEVRSDQHRAPGSLSTFCETGARFGSPPGCSDHHVHPGIHQGQRVFFRHGRNRKFNGHLGTR